MPRRPRILVEGAVYHVYNRTSRDLIAFGRDEDAERFLELLVGITVRDGWTVFAYCLMSNHYHLVLRSGPAPIARGVGQLQARFSQSLNWRERSAGPLWQGRYRAKLIDDEAYLYQVISYVHLNPIAAALVADPALWPWSGHRELIGTSAQRVVAVDTVLSLYGVRRAPARRAYVAGLRAGRSAEWLGERPGGLPWWPQSPDREIDAPDPLAVVDCRGVSTARYRPALAPGLFLELACASLGVELQELATRSRARELNRCRQLAVGVGVERWRQGTKSLAQLLNRRADVGTLWVRRCVERRQADSVFASDYLKLDRALSAAARRLIPE